MPRRLFFAASTGRTATMHLSNVLNSEPKTLCLHEGKLRNREESGEQVLPFLTLENRIAYEYPERRNQIIAEKRDGVEAIAEDYDCFGDVAYNNSPFLAALSEQFEDAKFVVMFRDGRTFVRSATLLGADDEAPVGWPPKDREITDMERYISLGRLQPRRDSHYRNAWEDWDFFERNTWLWRETNTLILDGLAEIDPERYFCVRFEDFVAKPLHVYYELRKFLGFHGAIADNVKNVLMSPRINARKEYCIGKYEEWDEHQKHFFWDVAGNVMEQLGYKNG